MNPLSPTQPSAAPAQVAQGSGFDLVEFNNRPPGQSSYVDMKNRLVEMRGRFGDSLHGLAERATRDVFRFCQEMLNKGLRLLQGGRQ
jgi:hypothetical protein